jgi:hypothetical protein
MAEATPYPLHGERLHTWRIHLVGKDELFRKVTHCGEIRIFDDDWGVINHHGWRRNSPPIISTFRPPD